VAFILFADETPAKAKNYRCKNSSHSSISLSVGMTEGVTELLWRGVPFGFPCSSRLSSSFSWPSRHGSVVLCGMRQFE